MATQAEWDPLEGLGANERALLEGLRWRWLQAMAAAVVRVKMRLQFTGWLQYLIPLGPTLALALVGAVIAALGAQTLALLFLVPAAMLALVVVFDIVTSKWRLRPPESRPAANDELDLFDLMRARHSCRSFQTRLMDEADREAVLASVEQELSREMIGSVRPRLEYIQAPLTVWPVVNGSEFIVAILPREYDRTAVIDVGRTLQRVVMAATRMGLGTCWIGPGADHESIEAHLGDRFDAAVDNIICVCAIGYPSTYIPLFVRQFTHFASTRRLPLTDLFFVDESFEEPIDVAQPPYDVYGRVYEICEWAPSSYNGQTTRAVVEVEEGAVSAVHFDTATASRYYAPIALGIWCANWELGCEALDLHGRFTVDADPEGKLPHRDVTWVPR